MIEKFLIPVLLIAAVRLLWSVGMLRFPRRKR